MTDVYSPTAGFADISAFVADANAINAATKTAFNLALTNIKNLVGDFTPGSGISDTNVGAAHPDFNKIPPLIKRNFRNELTVLAAAVTAHA